ncbi:HotDog domain-containing protein [Morchella snyderi]|nr:HotDog domain-containing protein [Morchella snyderi]
MNVCGPRLSTRLRVQQIPLRRIATAAPKDRKRLFALRLTFSIAAHVLLWGTAGVVLTNYFLPISGPLLKDPLPIRGSAEGNKTIEELEASASKLPIVKALRADPEYKEHRPWTGIPEEERQHRYTPGVLQGAEKIGYNKVWVKRDGSTVGVLSLGRGICGFPGVVHGGVLATIVDEALGRTAMHVLPTRNAVTARLSINYRRPAHAHLYPKSSGFVILRTWVIEHTDRKGVAKATIEDEFGNILIEAEGIFVVPRGWSLAEMPKGL